MLFFCCLFWFARVYISRFMRSMGVLTIMIVLTDIHVLLVFVSLLLPLVVTTVVTGQKPSIPAQKTVVSPRESRVAAPRLVLTGMWGRFSVPLTAMLPLGLVGIFAVQDRAAIKSVRRRVIVMARLIVGMELPVVSGRVEMEPVIRTVLVALPHLRVVRRRRGVWSTKPRRAAKNTKREVGRGGVTSSRSSRFVSFVLLRDFVLHYWLDMPGCGRISAAGRNTKSKAGTNPAPA